MVVQIAVGESVWMARDGWALAWGVSGSPSAQGGQLCGLSTVGRRVLWCFDGRSALLPITAMLPLAYAKHAGPYLCALLISAAQLLNQRPPQPIHFELMVDQEAVDLLLYDKILYIRVFLSFVQL